MKIIDCHSHYEPGILDSAGILKRMDSYNINMIALMSRVTENPLYKKSEFLMSIQRSLLLNKYLRPFAKILDESFHKKKGEWNPWYRKLIQNKKNFKILFNPDNDSIFELVNKYPKRFYGWIFLNPLIKNWDTDLLKYKDINIHRVLIGHPYFFAFFF